MRKEEFSPATCKVLLPPGVVNLVTHPPGEDKWET